MSPLLEEMPDRAEESVASLEKGGGCSVRSRRRDYFLSAYDDAHDSKQTSLKIDLHGSSTAFLDKNYPFML